MAKAAILWNDLGAGILRTGTSPVAGLGLDMLNDPQPRHRVRFAATGAFITVDLGSAKDVDCAALIGTANITDWKLRANSADSWGGAVTYDSGTISGAIDTAQPSANAVWCSDTAITARYWRWDLNGSNPIDVGLAPIGLLFRPTRNFAYGIQEGHRDLSVRDINEDTGAAFGLSLQRLRRRILTFPALTKDEIRGQIQSLDLRIGASGDVLFVENPGEGMTDAGALKISRDSFWGSYRRIGDDLAARSAFPIWGRAFDLIERP